MQSRLNGKIKIILKPIFRGNPDSILIPYMHRIIDPEEGAVRFLKFFVEDNDLIAEYSNISILPWNGNDKM